MLLPADFRTPEWERMKQHLLSRLARFREMNDNELDELSTARVRGRIGEIKELLALEPSPD